MTEVRATFLDKTCSNPEGGGSPASKGKIVLDGLAELDIIIHPPSPLLHSLFQLMAVKIVICLPRFVVLRKKNACLSSQDKFNKNKFSFELERSSAMIWGVLLITCLGWEGLNNNHFWGAKVRSKGALQGFQNVQI